MVGVISDHCIYFCVVIVISIHVVGVTVFAAETHYVILQSGGHRKDGRQCVCPTSHNCKLTQTPNTPRDVHQT